MRKTSLSRPTHYLVVPNTDDRRRTAELTLQYLMTEEMDEYTCDVATVELAARQLNHQHIAMARQRSRSLPPRRHSRNRHCFRP